MSYVGERPLACPKILVVDDEADVRNVVSAILKQAGYDVVVAEYGLSGYSKAQSEKPDLVLLDLMMPVVDGFEVLSKLKNNPRTSSIPVIILTAKIDAASERECMRLWAADYIKKPWGPRELQDRIGMALGYPDLGGPRQTRGGEPRTGGEADNSESSGVSQSCGLSVGRSHTDAERAPSEGTDLRQPSESAGPES
jgi:DNA-binding response OmpR family regulator